MFWRGCRHPGALREAPLHPATGLVRWLSTFSVVQQHNDERAVLLALVEAERAVLGLATELVTSSPPNEMVDAMALQT